DQLPQGRRGDCVATFRLRAEDEWDSVQHGERPPKLPGGPVGYGHLAEPLHLRALHAEESESRDGSTSKLRLAPDRWLPPIQYAIAVRQTHVPGSKARGVQAQARPLTTGHMSQARARLTPPTKGMSELCPRPVRPVHTPA